VGCGAVMRIAAISGSLQASSTNTRLIRAARERASNGTEVVVFEGLADIPAFNPDIEDPPPTAVTELRALLQSADGVLIASPEYAFGVPGCLKNALDWMVGSGDLYGKRVVVVSAAPSEERGGHARADLERTLGAQGATVLLSGTVAVRTLDSSALAATATRLLASF